MTRDDAYERTESRTDARIRGGWARVLALGLVALAACDGAVTPEHTPVLVVESYQVAGELLQPVRLTRTVSVNATFDASASGVSGAQVRMFLLDEAGEIESAFPFRETPGARGVYVSRFGHRVEPLRTYRLEVTDAATGAQLTAQTLVPGAFEVVAAGADTVVYQSPQQYEVAVTPSRYPGRQSYYIFSIEALDPRPAQLTPFYSDLVDTTGADVHDSLAEFVVNESNIINEANYDVNPDGTLRVRLPWLAVAFFGPTRLSVSAIDDNLYDFIRSQTVQQRGSTLSPGEIPNVLEHVTGGHGVFGSYARIELSVYVARPPETP